MKQIKSYSLILIPVWVFLTSSNNFIPFTTPHEVNNNYFNSDTCILDNQVYEIIDYKASNPLNATIKNSRIVVLDLNGNIINTRVIRYVFSVRRDDRIASIRSYGNLVSYPVLQMLKTSTTDEIFYFEEIIIVDKNKEIQENAVRPIIIKKIGH
ncbi:MAG: hypothetical protein U0W24_22350 [Bacteroidales bacterium]